MINSKKGFAPVSVIIPVRNGARLLDQALSSIQSQSWQPQETIVVDGDSNDNCEEVTARYPNTTYMRDPKAKAAQARNIGVERSSQPFLAFLDADDLWPEARVERLLYRLLEDEEAEIATGMLVQFRAGPAGEMLFQGAPAQSQLPTVAVMRRTAFGRVGPFSSTWKVGETVEWCARAKEAALKRVILSDVVLLRRLHEDNLGRSVEAPMRSYLEILHDTLKRRRAASSVDR